MEKKNQLKSCLTSPLAGEDARRAGEGDIKEKSYFTPSSVCSDFARQTTSPARGEVKQLGFTLIELLVVVLIIGILAAVALPQYQKAVEKARMTEAIMAVESIAKANEIYKMANGSYTRDINDLDIEYNAENVHYGNIPAKQTKYFMLAASNVVGDQNNIAVVQRLPSTAKYALSIRQNGKKICNTYNNISAYEQQLCQAWAAGQ